MESMISSLLTRYETGGLTRRDLIRGLTVLAAGTASGSAVAQTEPAPIRWSPLIDHIQINSRDPQKAAAFYQEVMGLELLRVGPAGPDRDCCPEESAFLGVGPAPHPGHPPTGNLMGSSTTGPCLRQATRRTGSELPSRNAAAQRPSTTLGGSTFRIPTGVLCQLMGRPGAP